MAKRQAGRFVTLRSGRVIFIPKGKRSRWAGVREKVLRREAEVEGKPGPEESKAAVRMAQAKDGGWKLGAKVRGGWKTRSVDLGGGSKGWLRIGLGGEVSAFTQFKGGHPQEADRPVEGLPSVANFRAMYSTE